MKIRIQPFQCVFFLSIIPLILFQNCAEHSKVNSPVTIDVENTFSKNETVNMSLFADSIFYIPLETDSGIIEKRIFNVSIGNNRIVVYGSPGLFLFNLKSGKFIREISHYGKDPGGYGYLNICPLTDTVVYLQGWKDNVRMIYGFHGEILDTIIVPIGGSDIYQSDYKNPEIYAYKDNLEGAEDSRIYSINKSGKIIKYFKNLQKFEDGDACTEADINFHFVDEKPRFKERFNDTLFEVNRNDLLPKFVFACGNKSLYTRRKDRSNPKFVMGEISVKEGQLYAAMGEEDYYYSVSEILESKKYLFYKVKYKRNSYSSVYIKSKNENYIDKKELVSEILYLNRYGFHNDIDNFLPFWPSSITKDGKYLVGYCEMTDVVKWFEDHPEQATKLPDDLRKIGEKNIEDNPIVMVVKLKE